MPQPQKTCQEVTHQRRTLFLLLSPPLMMNLLQMRMSFNRFLPLLPTMRLILGLMNSKLTILHQLSWIRAPWFLVVVRGHGILRIGYVITLSLVILLHLLSISPLYIISISFENRAHITRPRRILDGSPL
ncbi:hypothetical protein M569_17364 [Genlisea aurea]|uniref:Uncharacterized protein n=1 Tax=Genlisea aurea TaxID=192259 RepID=S8D486_9LAMI|nr:hypothetical protein M569_17364 [Genlisea aurea]